MKIAVDTNFLISATQWNYSVSHKLLQKLISNNDQIFSTKEILDEFAEYRKQSPSFKMEYNLMSLFSVLPKSTQTPHVKNIFNCSWIFEHY